MRILKKIFLPLFKGKEVKEAISYYDWLSNRPKPKVALSIQKREKPEKEWTFNEISQSLSQQLVKTWAKNQFENSQILNQLKSTKK